MERWHTHVLREKIDPSSMLIQGNRACALGALDAGVRFFADIHHSQLRDHGSMAVDCQGGRRVPADGGRDRVHLRMYRGFLAGQLAMTATSGPGFSLMQEAIGYPSWWRRRSSSWTSCGRAVHRAPDRPVAG